MRDHNGFTLIELLVVVLIIGILVAISIPQFSGTREKAFDAASRSDLRNMMTAMESYFSDWHAYTGATVTAGGTADLDGDGNPEIQASNGVSLQGTAYSDGFQVTAAHGSSTSTWCVNSSAANASGSLGVIVQGTSC